MAKVFSPYPYQQYAQNRIIDTPAIGLFLDMGLGKTVITLTALNELNPSQIVLYGSIPKCCENDNIIPVKAFQSKWRESE